MSNVSIYGKKWIDLVFEDRNQMYGAYQLRQQNPRVTLLALFWGVLLMGGFLSIALFSNFKNHDDPVLDEPTGIPSLHVTKFTQPIEEPIVDKPEKITPPNTVTNPVEPVINIFSTLTVTATQNAQDVPTNEEIKNIETPAIQGTITTPGIGTEPRTNNGNLNGSLVDTGAGNKGGEGISKTNEVDKLPSYPGGINNFYQYVANNFKNPDLETGSTVSVLVAFVVEKDGTISNIRVIRNSGYGTDKEAIRVLSALKTKWNPGIKNGEKVRTEFTLPIKVRFD
ncbi:energy transducer TonB [Flavobacterium capsici]|uniref:Energy transducer TonB n=1 Tax=Flavobacterium capsici TaxID=3075618 RepID=A0AA96J634_9FLAO|nr:MULTISPECIES: energy transducer TonB [unclassified Flavobacterium]WNM18855.1 energy transducer TonB [Flavobacterium sp. PMR2A8]WNM22905.1 energy transducer TonB [Flavobacterium sp. PMTSA4]